MSSLVFEFVDGTQEVVWPGSPRHRELLADGHAPVGSVPESDGISDALEAYLAERFGGALDTTDAAVASAVASGPATEAALSGSYARVRTYDIETYGAVPGATDANAAANTAAIAQAVADASAAGGGVVYVPTGEWRTDPFSLAANVTLQGATHGSSTLRRRFGNTAAGALVTVPTGATGVVVRDLTLFGQGSGTAQDVLYVNEVATHLGSLQLRNASRYGLHVGTGGDSLRANRVRVHTITGAGVAGFRVEGTDCFFTDCTAHTCDGHGFENRAENNHYIGCYAYFCGTEGGSVDGFYSASPNGHFVGCFGQDNGRAGLYLTGNADFTTVEGFRADSNGYAGIVLSATLEGGSAENLLGVSVTGFTSLTRVAAPRYTQDYGILGVGNVLRSTIVGTVAGNSLAGVSGFTSATTTVAVRGDDNTGGTRLPPVFNNSYLSARRSDGTEVNIFGINASDQVLFGGVSAAQTDVRLYAAGAVKMRANTTGVAFNGSNPVGKASDPGVATGTDAAVINAVVTALRNLGLVT